MAGFAARRGAVMFEPCGRIAMAAQAEVMKARLGSHLDSGPATSVTADAGFTASPVREVMVARDAVDFAMFVVRKVDCQGGRSPEQRLA